MKLCETLRCLRESSGFTVTQVADFLDIEDTEYEAMETGKAVPTVDQVEWLENLYGLNYDEIYQMNSISRITDYNYSKSDMVGIATVNRIIKNIKLMENLLAE